MESALIVAVVMLCVLLFVLNMAVGHLHQHLLEIMEHLGIEREPNYWKGDEDE